MRSNRLAILCAAFGFASFLNFSAQAQITVDGTKEADYGTALAVQSVTSGWGAGNTLASLSAKQEGGSLKVFIAGRANGNAIFLFIDSKGGGANVLVNNLITSGGDEYEINSFGTSSTSGMTFETGFSPDYAIRIHAGGWTSLLPLAPGSARSYLGQSTVTTVSGGPVTALRTVWNDVTGSYGTHTTGVEINLSLAGLGVPTGPGQTIKFMALLVGQGSNWGSNQTLGSLPAGSGDLAGGITSANFNTISGTQTISMSVDNLDADGDGISYATDPDDDNDGLDDTVETNTGTFVDATNTGTNPLLTDTDGDGYNDGAEVNGTSVLARVTSPLKRNYATMMVAGDFLTPTWSDAPTSANTMSRVAGQECLYSINYNFRTVGTFGAKFLGNSWATNWGDANPVTPGVAVLGGSNFSLVVGTTGFYTTTFNHDTLAYSFGRTVFADFAAYETAYGLTGDESADQDSDGITNGAEFIANTDPTRANDALAPVITLANSLVALVAGGNYVADAATATDNTDGNVTANITNNSATILDATARNTPGTYTVTYSVNDAAGNTGTAAQKVVVYGAGTFASQYPSIAVPGAFNGWATDGSAGNALKKMANFTWHGIKYFTTDNASGGFKFLAGGSWGGKEWAPLPRDGGGNSDLAANVTTNGWYLFAVTELNDTASVSRLEVNPTSDADSDGIPDVLEAYFGSFLATPLADLDPTADYNNNQKTALEDYEQGINPTQDTIAPTLAWAPAVAKLTQVAVDSGGGQYLGASSEVVASSEVPGEVPLVTVLHRLISGSNPGVFDAVDTSSAGLWQVEYTASDDFGNSSTLIRVVVVGDQVPVSPSGWFGLNYPASATISTLGSQSVYAQIYINNATPGAGQAPAIQCWIGVSSDNTDPSTWVEGAWTLASHNAGQTGNNDEYSVPLSGATLGVGTHNYAARWQIGSGAYFYGGIDAGGNGNAWNATTHPSGVLTVNAAVARDVTFAVDMGVQAFRGAFSAGTDAVYLVGDVTNWTTGTAMVREGETNVYKLTLNLEGAENATLNYKFKSSNTAVGNGGFEGDMDAGVPGDTPRVLTLGAANVPQSLTTSTFNNQSEARKITVRVDMSIQDQAGNFNPSTGTIKVGGTFNGWTAASLVAQGSGIYAGEFLVDGPLSDVEYKFMNGDTYESISNRTITVALPNLAASTLDPVYFNNHDVAVADSTFAGAYPGKSMTDVAPNGLTYLANYAFGGDSNTQPILPVQDMSDPDKLRLIVVYRTDDPTLPLSGLRGEATTSLSGAWDLPDVSVTDGDRTGLPDNLTRKVISVDRGSDLKKFLRATVTR